MNMKLSEYYNGRAYIVDPDSGCWVWLLAVNYRRNRPVWTYSAKPHITFWVERHGPVPNKCDLHHRCWNTLCVNPDHLVPLTRDEHANQDHGTVEQLTAIDRSNRIIRKWAKELINRDNPLFGIPFERSNT